MLTSILSIINLSTMINLLTMVSFVITFVLFIPQYGSKSWKTLSDKSTLKVICAESVQRQHHLNHQFTFVLYLVKKQVNLPIQL